jgi:hypothetical protein
VPNIEQVFSVLLFPLLVLTFIQFVLNLRIPLKPISIGLLGFLLVAFNVPAIQYDNSTPLHKEKIPEDFFKESIFKQPCVNVLSISKYRNFPFFDEQQLGNGILDRVDNVAITMGGFEQFSPEQRKLYEGIPFGKYLLRLPEYEFRLTNNGSLDGFLDSMKVKIVLLEDEPTLVHYKQLLSKRTTRIYFEPETRYWIVVLR